MNYTYSQGMIWVQGEAGAMSYPVQINQTVPLWDKDEQVIYLKSADVMGRPSMKILDYTIREEPKDELTLLREKIAELEERIGANEQIISADEPDVDVTTVKK